VKWFKQGKQEAADRRLAAAKPDGLLLIISYHSGRGWRDDGVV